jgi:hypothetical protein
MGSLPYVCLYAPVALEGWGMMDATAIQCPLTQAVKSDTTCHNKYHQ